jgi:hypothetical protein
MSQNPTKQHKATHAKPANDDDNNEHLHEKHISNLVAEGHHYYVLWKREQAAHRRDVAALTQALLDARASSSQGVDEPPVRFPLL